MAILSKPLYSIIDGVNGDPTLVEGFNTKYGEDFRDVHFWCEDEFGKVYDTTPIPEHPSGSTQFAYLKWDNQGGCFDEYSDAAWKQLFRVNPRLTDTPYARTRFPQLVFREGDYFAQQQCHMNSHALASHHPHLKVVVGSLGFKLIPSIVEINWGQ
tara:strand:+ start:597 stop:1064 length:468 start_codon:yes stop_codon:yes gene_type:complete